MLKMDTLVGIWILVRARSNRVVLLYEQQMSTINQSEAAPTFQSERGFRLAGLTPARSESSYQYSIGSLNLAGKHNDNSWSIDSKENGVGPKKVQLLRKNF